MNHNIKGTEVAVTSELREYLERKLEHAEKLLQNDASAHADIELEYASAREGVKYRAEFTVSAKNALYRSECWGETLHAAIDAAVSEIVTEVGRARKKRVHLVRRGALKAKEILRGLRERF